MRVWVTTSSAIAALAIASVVGAADHRDAPGTKADPAADINDVYAWVEGEDLILAMTVFPVADASSQFSDAIQYVIHVGSTDAFGTATVNTDIICTFSSGVASCWAGANEYVTGDAGVAAGITSASGDFKVFAGLRADPFFFNLSGFNDAVATVTAAAPTLMFDPAGCPNVNQATSTALVGQLQGTMSGTMPAVDFFKDLDTLAIVVSIKKSLVTPAGPLLAVWGSTHTAP